MIRDHCYDLITVDIADTQKIAKLFIEKIHSEKYVQKMIRKMIELRTRKSIVKLTINIKKLKKY